MTEKISSHLKEKRRFKPPAAFAKGAHIKSRAQFDKWVRQARRSPEKFWAERARELKWIKPWKKTLVWKYPFAKWFVGGRINVSENCLDRHLAGPRRNKAALIWEGERGENRTITYQQLHREVCRFANALKAMGIKSGDCVAIYLPLIPEAAIAMLACARIGAVHNVVFGGFSAEALRDRIRDSEAKLVITADGTFRKGRAVPLKEAVDEALKECPTVGNVVCVRHTKETVHWTPGRDVWWHEAVEKQPPVCRPAALDSEHPLFILYTSGSTGKPKGVLHTTGGYLTQVAYTAKIVFDLKEEDTFWCTADVGWVTGHSYVVYGPLANGATTVMYEGAPLYPDPGRFWDIVEKYRVSVFYTAPTAIRTFIRLGSEHPKKRDLSSLRLLGTVGEPINPEAWIWYHRVIGGKRCPIVDTYWQTETGAVMISPVPGAIETKPGSATLPLPGISAKVVDEKGRVVPPGSGGLLVFDRPWPGMLRTVHGDPGRYRKQYFSKIPGTYFTGDGARVDADGYFWILGRVDDVINVSGHRLSTMEIESALVGDPRVAEAAVVGHPDEVKGQGITAFVTLAGRETPNEGTAAELQRAVVKHIGSIARPDVIRFTDALPKTRSGKIMRRLLRDVAAGRKPQGDTTTLEDFGAFAKLVAEE